MKLDPKQIRYLTPEDWRVLTAVEQGSRNHLVVPTTLITTLTNARGGSQITQSISSLAKSNLIAKVKNASYDGYRLTYGGLDFLALHSHLKSGTIYSVGNQIGVGKESDINVVASPNGRRLVLKIHRLGRTSFRTVKNNREYLRKGGSGTWMYMSTLAARKEWTFMRALRESGFVVPEPVGWNRHTVVMELIDAFPLRQISVVPEPAKLYGQLIEIILRLARFGLIHADFNEFNILIEEREISSSSDDDATPPEVELIPILIDFPQTLSISHPNAEFYFNRDVNCIKTFFERRFHFVSDEEGPFFKDAEQTVGVGEGVRRLDLEVEASGFNRKMAKELEKYMREHGVDGDAGGEAQDNEDEDGEELEADPVSTDELIPLDATPIPLETSPLPTPEDLAVTPSPKDLPLQPTPPNEDHLTDGMMVLQLSSLPESTPVPISSIRGLPLASVAAPTSYAHSRAGTISGRQKVNPAKKAGGWAI